MTTTAKQEQMPDLPFDGQYKTMGEIFTDGTLRAAEKLVMLDLAYRYGARPLEDAAPEPGDGDGGDGGDANGGKIIAFSLSGIAKDCSLNTEQVLSLLNRLKDTGYVEMPDVYAPVAFAKGAGR